jgi:transketolase
MSVLRTEPGEVFGPYGKALVEVGERNERVVVLGADLAGSTEIDGFRDRFPDRFFNLGVAEQNAVGVAAGLAIEGFIPLFHSFGVFTTRRPYEQVCVQVAMDRANVKLVGALPGLSSRLGATHQAVDDLSLMRTLPGMVVVDPADAVEMAQVLEAAVDHEGPFYFRMMRRDVPVLFEEGYRFTLGRAVPVADGGDVTLVSTGSMLAAVLEARERLEGEGIRASVLHVPTIKPMDTDAVVERAEATGALVTVENHLVTGGLGSAVAEVLADRRPCPVERIGLRDVFASPGTPEYLLEKYAMGVDDIARAARDVLGRKG